MCVAPLKMPNPHFRKLSQTVPCGKCPECLSHRAVQWAQRVEHELTLSPESAFITLTYDPEKKSGYNYDYSDFQSFVKVLRRRYDHQKIKHFTSIEYGENYGRLHYHSILFNFYPTTRKHTLAPLKKTDSGFTIFRSSELESMWTHGFSSVAPASPQTAYYIASYALSDSSFECPVSGEILSDKLRCSQGIGLDYFIKHRHQIQALAFFRGHSIPRYYKKKLEELYPSEYAKFESELASLKKSIVDNGDNYARLKDQIAKSSIAKNVFRSQKDFTNLLSQLNDHELTREINRRYFDKKEIQ